MSASSLLDLRPLSIAELFDRSFRLYRNNFGTFLGIILITQLPIYLFSLITAAVENSSNMAGLTIIATILTLIFTQLGVAVLTKCIAHNYLGRKVNFKESFERVDGTWFTLIFASILAGLVVAGLALPFACIFTLVIPPATGFSYLGFWSIITIIGVSIMASIANVLVSLVAPAVVLEKKGPMDSVKRAWELAKKRFWWSFGNLFLLGLLSYLVVAGPVTLLQFLFETILGETSPLFQSVVGDAASSLLSAIFMPIRLAAVTLMYFDLRIRFEGFDLMVLASNDDEFADDVSDFTTQTIL